jgi:hypothetical protein
MKTAEKIIDSKNHAFYVFDTDGVVFEVIKMADWWFANTQNGMDLNTGNRFSRFLASGSWNGSMVRDYLTNRKYVIAE